MILISCNNYAFILKIAGYLFKIMRWAVPIALIFLATLDLFKAFTTADDKAKKDLGTKIMKRFIYAIVILLIPILVKIIFKAVAKASPQGYGDDNSPTTWTECFNQYFF